MAHTPLQLKAGLGRARGNGTGLTKKKMKISFFGIFSAVCTISVPLLFLLKLSTTAD